MSTLRPECVSTNERALYNGDAYFAVLNAVKQQPGLIAGRLHNGAGGHCALGSYFAQPKHLALPSDLIEEIAAVNDAIGGTPKHRRHEMLRWLRWKLGRLGFPGYARSKKP